jgi:hypothetical protein
MRHPALTLLLLLAACQVSKTDDKAPSSSSSDSVTDHVSQSRDTAMPSQRTVTPQTAPQTAPPGAPAPAPPNLHAAQQLLNAAKRGGVDSAVALIGREVRDGLVWDGISSGDSTWLEVAAVLQQTGSAETSEAVSESLRQAVPRAPERMLSLIARGVFTEDVCVEQEYDVTIRALASVQRQDLRDARERCRAVVEREHSQ